MKKGLEAVLAEIKECVEQGSKIEALKKLTTLLDIVGSVKEQGKRVVALSIYEKACASEVLPGEERCVGRYSRLRVISSQSIEAAEVFLETLEERTGNLVKTLTKEETS